MTSSLPSNQALLFQVLVVLLIVLVLLLWASQNIPTCRLTQQDYQDLCSDRGEEVWEIIESEGSCEVPDWMIHDC